MEKPLEEQRSYIEVYRTFSLVN